MQFVIFHGSFGSKEGNWFPWLKKKIEQMGHEVFLEQYPIDNWDDIERQGKDNRNTIQNLSSWIKFFSKNTLPHLDRKKDLILVGHSLSPVFILHLVGRFNLQLKGALFVSPFLSALEDEKIWHFDVVNKSFFKTDFDWKKLQKLIPCSYTLYGTDDPYVPNRLPIAFAKNLNSTLIPVKDGKHLGDNFIEFPLLLDLVKKISE